MQFLLDVAAATLGAILGICLTVGGVLLVIDYDYKKRYMR